MVVTVAQAVRILSKGLYSIGPEGTISTEDALLLEELMAGEVSRKDPGFTAAELVRYRAYLILDVLSNSSGMGIIVEKKVNLVAWKLAKSSNKGSTSMWSDYAAKMIAEFGKGTMPSGVMASDAFMHGLDSTEITQYGEPSLSTLEE